MRYTALQPLAMRRLFDPSNKNDLLELKYFIKHSRWVDKCPFYLEEYWDNVPTMCMHKYAEYMLDQIKTPVVKKQKSPK